MPHMDLQKFLVEQGMQDLPVGLSGCRAHGDQFDLCDYDIIVFDGKLQDDRVVRFGDGFVNLHHYSIHETRTDLLIYLDRMQIISDRLWELGTPLSRFKEMRHKLFRDYAKNRLMDSLFCCEKSTQGMQSSDPFSSCWQKCALYLLTDAVFALNQRPPSPSHALEITRRFEKNPINEKMSAIIGMLGIERATPSLLERMLKSTVGFSDMVECNGHSMVIRDKHDYLVRNSMLSDCYFYLGHINKSNFIRMRDSISQRPDLIHLLRIAFDLEADHSLTLQHVRDTQDVCQEILESIFRQ